MKRNISILLLFALLLSAFDPLLAQHDNVDGVPKLTVSQLLANKNEYYGKRVSIVGFYRSGFERSALYETDDDADNFRDNGALWVMTFKIKPGYEPQIRQIERGLVRVVGVFSYNRKQTELGVGHLNGWPAELVQLELLEPMSKERPNQSRDADAKK